MERFLTNLAHRMLLKLPPETAHSIAKFGMKRKIFAPGRYETPASRTKLFDIDLLNPFGIAAGFDKYAQLHDVVWDYGFGWIETGSFTFQGGRGNEKPRLFRLHDGGLLNRMGLNCVPAIVAAERYSCAKNQYSFAPSIAKTNDISLTGDKAIEDLTCSYSLLKKFGIYIAINLSCPNTKDNKTFEEPEILRELICALREQEKVRPVVFKFSPNLGKVKLEKLVETSFDFADGYEAVNTIAQNDPMYGKGGLSGPVLREFALDSVFSLRQMTDKPIIGVGGISTGREAYAMKSAGADVFLSYTGFVYGCEDHPFAGSNFAWKINEDYRRLIGGDKSK